MPQHLLNRPQLYVLMNLITEILIIMTIVYFVTVKLLCKSVIGLQKINKLEAFWWPSNNFKIFGIDLFLNTLNLPILLNFTHPKIRITNLDGHTFLCVCGHFADRNVEPFSQIDI